jgi:hypothetical protein
MSVSNDQANAEEYAIKNCVYNKGKDQVEILSPTCEMSLTDNSYVARPTTADQENGYHNIEGYGYVKPVLSTDTTGNFGAIIRIEDMNGGTIDMNSEKGKALLKKPEFVEVYSRSLAFVKFTAFTTKNEGFNPSDLSPATRNFDMLEAATEAIAETGDKNLNDAWNRIRASLWTFTSYKDLDTPGHSPEISNLPFETKDGNYNTTDSEIEEENQTVENLDTNNGLGEIFKLHPVLKYPSDAAYGSGGQDYIRFETFKYQPPNIGAFGKANQYGIAEKKNKSEPQIIKTFGGESIPRNSNLGEYGNTIKLPIPNDLRVSNGVEWGGAKANAIEMAAFQGATNKLDDVQQKGFQSILDNIGDIGKLMDTLGKLDVDDQAGGTAMTAFLSKQILSMMNINVDTNQFVARSLGIAINPNLELLFSSPKLRNFTFRFDFAPNDEKDAQISRHIMRVFRQGMQPTGYGGREVNTETGARIGTSNIFIGAPRVFRIGYFNGSNRIRGLPVHKICALTQVSTNFTPENVYQSYSDSRAVSNPVRTTMELAFTELTPIFAEDYLGDGEGGTDQQKDNKSLRDLDSVSGVDSGVLNGDNALNTEDIGF